MLSARTLRDASASRRARSRACVSRFMRSRARRMYAARESLSAPAQRLLASSRSSGSLREMALIGRPPGYLNRVCDHDIPGPAMINHLSLEPALPALLARTGKRKETQEHLT